MVDQSRLRSHKDIQRIKLDFRDKISYVNNRPLQDKTQGWSSFYIVVENTQVQCTSIWYVNTPLKKEYFVVNPNHFTSKKCKSIFLRRNTKALTSLRGTSNVITWFLNKTRSQHMDHCSEWPDVFLVETWPWSMTSIWQCFLSLGS